MGRPAASVLVVTAATASVEAPTKTNPAPPASKAVSGAYETPERGSPEPFGATLDPETVSKMFLLTKKTTAKILNFIVY